MTGSRTRDSESLREMEVQRRRGMTSPDPEKNPEPLRGLLGGFRVGIPREEKTLRASQGFSSERLSEAFPPLVLHLRSSSREENGTLRGSLRGCRETSERCIL